MPPKKEQPPQVIPDIAEEVVLPEGVGPVPEPHFCLVLGHLFSHTFLVSQELEDGEHHEPISFDPKAVLVQRAKVPATNSDDLLARLVAVVEREELNAAAIAEGLTMAKALRARLEKERAARSRAKTNAARRRAIAAYEAAKAAADEDAADPAQQPAHTEEAPKADFLLVTLDYPSDAKELRELAEEGLCTSDLIDAWAAVYLAGETVDASAVVDDGLVDEPATVACETPALVREIYSAIQAAPAGSELSGCTVCTMRNTHKLAFPPEGVEQVKHVQDAVLAALGAEAGSKRNFKKWLSAAVQVEVPPLDEHRGDARLYHRMMSAIDGSHHDVPLFLHCLTEQVERTLGGEAQRHEDEVALSSLMEYLGASCEDALTEGSGLVPKLQRVATADSATKQPAEKPAGPEEEGPLLSWMDRSTIAHHLSGNTEVAGQPIGACVKRVLEQVCAAGVKRHGLPRDAMLSVAQRQALAHRLYPFAPQVPSAQLEQLVLQYAFEELLSKAQPERKNKWCLRERTFRERVPRELLGQALEAATLGEPFMSTMHIPRYDCLLVALHYRSPGCRVMWHSWRGDLFADPESKKWQEGLFSTPTYNDWAQVFGGRSGEAPQPCRLLQGFDARELGYGGMFEKLATPPDGSIILVTRIEIGLSHSFPAPSNDEPPGVVAEMERAERRSVLDDGASSATGTTVLASKFQHEVGSRMKSARCDVPPRRTMRLARVLKDGLAFGITPDRSFEEWRLAENARRAAAREAAVAAAAAANAEGDGEGAGRTDEDAAALLPGPAFPDASLGHFWISLPGGARCTARMHHERALAGGDASITGAAESLPPMGVVLTYTQASGQVVQVFGDGTVSLMQPHAFSPGVATPSGDPAAPGAGVRRGGRSGGYLPGCAGDVEVSRTVTPHGSLARRLLSGRVEVCHADGTAASRNPTLAELAARLQDLRARPGGIAGHTVELMEKLLKVYEERHAGPLREPPSEAAKATGLPGHWVVVRPDGRAFGRVACEQQAAMGSVVLSSDGDAGAAAEVPEHQQSVESSGHTPPGSAHTAPAAEPSLQELLGARLVQGGAVLEYDITDVPAALQEDLQTKHRATTNALGLASFEDPMGMQKISVHADGTQIMRTRREEGYDIDISKEPLPHIRCEIAQSGVPRTHVECADGAHFEVSPLPAAEPSSGRGWEAMLEPFYGDSGHSAAARSEVILRCRGGVTVHSKGGGQVEVFTGSDQNGTYTAFCDEGRLVLLGAVEKGDCEEVEGHFEVRADQSLVVPEPVEKDQPLHSPRCTNPNTAYRWPGTEFVGAPEEAPPPRLFAIYGDGEAEELLDASEARRLLDDASEDPLATVIEGPDMGECKSHVIFRKRLPDVPVAPPLGSMALPESFDTGGSSCYSVFEASTHMSMQAPAPAVTEYRHLIEYPEVTTETREKFRGTFKQYRQWEAHQLARSRFAMQGPEAAKGKKDGKKGKDKEDKKKSKLRNKKSLFVEVQASDNEGQPEPAFIQDFQISAFEHHVQVLRMRASVAKQPSADELFRHALETRKAQMAEVAAEAQEAAVACCVKVANVDFELLADRPELYASVEEAVKSAIAAEVGHGVTPADVVVNLSAGSLIVDATIAAPAGVPAATLRQQLATNETLGNAVAAAVGCVEGIEEVAEGPIVAYAAVPGHAPAIVGAGPTTEARCTLFDNAGSRSGSAARGTRRAHGTGGSGGEERSRSKQKAPSKDTDFSFGYFKSEMGLQFLMDMGELDPEKKPRPPKLAGSRAVRRPPPAPARSPWNPRLVGEEPDPPPAEPPREEAAHRYASQGRGFPEEDQYQSDGEGNPVDRRDTDRLPFLPGARVEAVAPGEIPSGPHPDKKSMKWDTRGELRPPKPPIRQAHVEINTGYLEVEGPTDRRVRTSSIAHKKNSAKAPSVQTVRKIGAHAVGRGTEISAKELVGDITTAGAEEHWRLSSTMQGLGDANNLVEVMPGACRFGPLCLGNVYRMNFYLRNLDVDVTRYLVNSRNENVKICHNPGELVGQANRLAGHLAPGMAKKIVVEIAARTPVTVEDKIEITVKAHHIKVDVFAVIMDVEEYEKADATEMALHGRHIGRSRERGDPGSSVGKAPVVELVADPEYTRRALGELAGGDESGMLA